MNSLSNSLINNPNDSVLLAYENTIKEGLVLLCAHIFIPLPLLNKIVRLRCNEIDAILPFTEMVPIIGTISDYSNDMSLLLLQTCGTLSKLLFHSDFQNDNDTKYLSALSRRILCSLYKWKNKTKDSLTCTLTGPIMCIILMDSFMGLVVSSIRQDDLPGLHWLVFLSMRVFSFLNNIKKMGMSDLDVLIIELMKSKDPFIVIIFIQVTEF